MLILRIQQVLWQLFDQESRELGKERREAEIKEEQVAFLKSLSIPTLTCTY